MRRSSGSRVAPGYHASPSRLALSRRNFLLCAAAGSIAGSGATFGRTPVVNAAASLLWCDSQNCVERATD